MTIYEPAEDSFLLQKWVKLYASGRALDLGTGSGIQALTMAKMAEVREIVAVDVNPEAVEKLQQEIKDQRLRKVKVISSDLLAQVDGCFNTIVFNPPYLPQDKGIEDSAIYGGKKGWEISERFFREAARHLFPEGTILFLFSSLTDKAKIEEIISHHLLEFKELDRMKLAFEELYVYLITKTKLLVDLERQGMENISYFARGKRGQIFIGILDRSKLVKTHFPSRKQLVKVAIKIKKPESEAQERLRNEAEMLKLVNREGIGPRLLGSGQDYVIYEFVEGQFILDWLKDKTKADATRTLVKVLEQCFRLDELKLSKEEMHHPLKHILVDNLGEPI